MSEARNVKYCLPATPQSSGLRHQGNSVGNQALPEAGSFILNCSLEQSVLCDKGKTELSLFALELDMYIVFVWKYLICLFF